ncbi:MAG: hypothetical protein D6753_13450 [Planctomycetota bacterium]|nr:MAG: hypothetical protein D6753_13450 [Planctomycetota bacterium]
MELQMEEPPAVARSGAAKPARPAVPNKPPRTKGKASLWPKEHGAYAILGVPLAVTWGVVGISIPGGLMGLAAVAGFFANEPLLVVLGRRGRRAARALPHAAARGAALFCLAIVAGGLAMYLADATTRVALMGWVCVASLAWAMHVRLGGRSLFTQLVGIAALVFPVLPIVLAAGWDPADALSYWGAWSVAQASPALAVRNVIALQKRQPDRRAIRLHDWGLGALLLVACGGTALGWLGWWQVLPMVVAGLILRCLQPSPRHLQRIGWTLVAVNCLAGLLMLGTLG